MFYELTPEIALAVIPKVASQSILEAVGSFNGRELRLAEALTKPRRVVVLRDPIERLKSVFNHYYGAIGKCHTDMSETITPGIITADGYRLRGGLDANPHHFTGQVEQEYLARVSAKKAGRRISDLDLSLELDDDDYQRLVRHIRSGEKDPHWLPQIGQITFEGKVFANEIVQFEDLNEWWTVNVNKGVLPHRNSWIRVNKTEDYMLTALEAYYSVDRERRV